MSRFDYVKYDAMSVEVQANFKKEFEQLALMVINHIAEGRAQSLVLTKLEEAYMWVGKAIRDEQIERNGEADLQEQRNDE